MSEPFLGAHGSKSDAGVPRSGPVSPEAARRALFVALLCGALLGSRGADAAERVPFVDPVEPPRPLLVSGHFGSHHRDGYGGAIGFVPVRWIQLEVSAAYRYETSLAALVRFLPLPTSALGPFVAIGMNRATSKLPGRLGYTTVSTFGTVGLQARVSGRYFVSAELAILYELYDVARVGKVQTTFEPSQRFDFVPGAFLGAYLP